MFGKDLIRADVEKMGGIESIVTLVNREGLLRGYAREADVHERGARRMHKAVQVFIWSPDKQQIVIKFNRSGECEKTWGTIATHVYYAEDYYAAMVRELNTKFSLGLSILAAQNRMRLMFNQDACIGTKMEHIRLYSLVLNSGEVVKSKEPMLAVPFDSLRDILYDNSDFVIAPVFRLLFNKFRYKFTTSPRWRDML